MKKIFNENSEDVLGTRSDFLLQTFSNIYYQDGERILELNKKGLKGFFSVDKIKLI